MEQLIFRAAVIGGGAAGLTAAIGWSRQLGKGQVILLEKQHKTGRKLLATGNGRCNISNEGVSPAHYHGDEKIIHSVLSHFSVSDMKDFFHGLGVWLRSDSEGRIYPYSNQAVTIAEALQRECRRYGVQERPDCHIQSVRKEKGRFIITAEDCTIRCDILIIACGSQAAPSLGADDSGYRLLKSFGMEPTPLFPALSPLTMQEKRRSLKGIRAKGQAVLLADGKPLRRTEGEIQFTDYGLSGICIFELSRPVNEFFTIGTADGQHCKQLQIALDVLPDYSFREVCDFLEETKKLYVEECAGSLLSGLLPQKLAEEIARTCHVAEKSCKALTVQDIKQLTGCAKRLIFTPCKCSDFASAQVSAGGIDSRFVDPATLMARQTKNLFLCGEILDVDGDCGGYNLQFAFASGMCAGDHL